MAQQGMFGNQYQQAVTDETALRRQQAQTGGLTGWAAITNAMSGIGSEIGYQGGQAMGGQTAAQVQQSNFQSVMDSVPDFNPADPASLQAMSSSMWQAGFYDEGMAMMDRASTITAANAQNDYVKAKTESELGPNLADLRTQQLIDKEALNLKAVDFMKGIPSDTLEEKEALLTLFKQNGLYDSTAAGELSDEIQSFKGVSMGIDRSIALEKKEAARAEEALKTQQFKPVLENQKGTSQVKGYFLTNPPSGLGTEDTATLATTIGDIMETYDNTLSTSRGQISPGVAEPYYLKVLSLSDVYNPNTEAWAVSPGDDYAFSEENFKTTLDTTFGRKGKFIRRADVARYLDNDLIIPGVTLLATTGGIGAVTQETIDALANGTMTYDQIFGKK